MPKANRLLAFKPGVTLDYEMTPSVAINVTATDGRP